MTGTMLPGTLATASLLAGLLAWTTYLATIPSGRVPIRPVAHVVLSILASVLGGAGLVLLVASGRTSWLVATPALGGIVLGLGFLLILSQRKTPVGALRLRVLEKLPKFRAMTSDGAAFESDAFAGQRILLKFFRGAW